MDKRKTIQDILNKKQKGEKIIMLTAYDFPMARIIDECNVDMILVGDSLANVILGLESTRDVTLEEMIHHTKAVNRGVKNAMLIGDMPFESYQAEPKMSVDNAKRFIDEAGCDAVKLEWFDGCVDVASKIVGVGMQVMGHVGLTPQTADRLGGFVVQGREADSAKKLIHQAKQLEEAGCFSIVLECIPAELSGIITQELKVPTIGIGAGVRCDGQVLVTHDILGLFDMFRPKFVKQYVDLKEPIHNAVQTFIAEVNQGQFPDRSHSFTISEGELKKIQNQSSNSSDT